MHILRIPDSRGPAEGGERLAPVHAARAHANRRVELVPINLRSIATTPSTVLFRGLSRSFGICRCARLGFGARVGVLWAVLYARFLPFTNMLSASYREIGAPDVVQWSFGTWLTIGPVLPSKEGGDGGTADRRGVQAQSRYLCTVPGADTTLVFCAHLLAVVAQHD